MGRQSPAKSSKCCGYTCRSTEREAGPGRRIPTEAGGTVRRGVGRCRESVRVRNRPKDRNWDGLAASFLQLAKRRDHRQARGAPGGKQPAEQAHGDRVDKGLNEQRGRNRKGERHLAE
jgi:hypothetical protein